MPKGRAPRFLLPLPWVRTGGPVSTRQDGEGTDQPGGPAFMQLTHLCGEESVCPWDEQMAGAPDTLTVSCLFTRQWREFRGSLCEGMSREWWAELECKDRAGIGRRRDQGWANIGAREGDVVGLTVYSLL